MKKIAAVFVAIVIGLVFVSTVSSQLELEKAEKPKRIKTRQIQIKPPQKIEPKEPELPELKDASLVPPELLTAARRECFPRRNYSEAGLKGNSIWTVNASYYLPSKEPYVSVHTEKCHYIVDVDSYAEALGILNALTLTEGDFLLVLPTEPMECYRRGEGLPYVCRANIVSISRYPGPGKRL